MRSCDHTKDLAWLASILTVNKVGLFESCSQSPIETVPKGHDSECAQFQIATTPNEMIPNSHNPK